MKHERNKYITKGMEAVLRDMRALQKDDIPEIVCEGLQCWVGQRRTTWAVVNRLLRLCLLRHEHSETGFQRFEPNEETYRVLDDSSYEPMIVEAMRTGKTVQR